MIINVRFGSGEQFTITQQEEGGAACIESSLTKNNNDGTQYSAAMNTMESMILSMHCAGIDVTSKAFIAGLESTLDAVENNYG